MTLKMDVSELPLGDCAQLVAEDNWFFYFSREEGPDGRVVLVASRLDGYRGLGSEALIASPLALLPAIQFQEGDE